MKVSRLASLAALGLLAASAHAQTPIFSENFGTGTSGTTITTSNTSFTYARVGTGTGALLQFLNPANVGSGSSARMLATTGSLTGFGVTSGTYSAFDVGTFQFDVRTPTTITNASSFFVGFGTGTNTFTGNATFTGTDLTAAFQITASGGVPAFQSRVGSAWNTVAGVTIAGGTNYNFSMVFNGSASSVNYDGGNTVAAGKADVFVNNVLLADEVSISDLQSVSAFRMYVTGQTAANGSWEVDNIALFNSAVYVTIPEPGTFALAALGLAGLVLRRRK